MLAPHGGGPMWVLSPFMMISAASSSQFRGQETRGWFLRTTPRAFFGGRGQWGVGGDPDDGNATRKVETPFVRIQRAG